MKKIRTSSLIATGFAMFSMFFGAGNIIFPLDLGRFAKEQSLWAFLGLFITAVLVPFFGLLTMTLFDGNYRQFFGRVGKVPGFFFEIVILALIGPFGALPRCIVLAHSSLHVYLEQMQLVGFSLVSCIVIFLCTFRRTRMLDILGYVLTPVLLLSLAIIIGKGVWEVPSAQPTTFTNVHVFIHGLVEGYQTMDLLASFFFSAVVLLCLRKELDTGEAANHRKLIGMTVRAGCLGMSLLALVYWGFTFIASRFNAALLTTAKEELLGKVALVVLGPEAGIVAAIAVALACLTTAIALAAVFSEFLHEDIFSERISYVACLLITLAIAYGVSTLEFAGIARLLSPILVICYPALIILTFFNLVYKLTGLRYVKGPFYVTLLISAVAYFF